MAQKKQTSGARDEAVDAAVSPGGGQIGLVRVRVRENATVVHGDGDARSDYYEGDEFVCEAGEAVAGVMAGTLLMVGEAPREDQ